jgi:hypothetical protein
MAKSAANWVGGEKSYDARGGLLTVQKRAMTIRSFQAYLDPPH